jgi:transcription antitermination factor NusG
MQIVRSTPGIIRLITRGGKPCPVAFEEIAALQRVMEANRDVCVSPYLRVGQRAQIISGPLMGVVGIIVRFKHGDRLVLSVDLIMKSVAVEIDSSELAPLPIQPQANRTLLQTPCRNTA